MRDHTPRRGKAHVPTRPPVLSTHSHDGDKTTVEINKCVYSKSVKSVRLERSGKTSRSGRGNEKEKQEKKTENSSFSHSPLVKNDNFNK